MYDSDAWMGEACVAADETGVCVPMNALAMACCCAASAGGADMDIDVENGGSWLKSYGGGGKPSVAVGEFELFRIREPTDGENMPRGGNGGFREP